MGTRTARDHQEHSPTMTAETQQAENKALVEQFYDELDDHNLNVMDELLADDYTTGIYRSGESEPIDGKAGMKELWQEYFEAFPDFEGQSMELIAEDDRVAIFREERGTHEGEFRGIEPTGEEITFEYSGYFVVEDGQFVHGHFRGNMLDLLKQLGVESPLPQ